MGYKRRHWHCLSVCLSVFCFPTPPFSVCEMKVWHFRSSPQLSVILTAARKPWQTVDTSPPVCTQKTDTVCEDLCCITTQFKHHSTATCTPAEYNGDRSAGPPWQWCFLSLCVIHASQSLIPMWALRVLLSLLYFFFFYHESITLALQ